MPGPEATTFCGSMSRLRGQRRHDSPMLTVPLSADQRTTPLHPADVNRRLPAGGNHHPRQLRRQAETGGAGGDTLRAVTLDEGFSDNSAWPGRDLLVSGHGRHNRRASFLFKGGPTARSEPPPAGPHSVRGRRATRNHSGNDPSAAAAFWQYPGGIRHRPATRHRRTWVSRRRSPPRPPRRPRQARSRRRWRGLRPVPGWRDRRFPPWSSSRRLAALPRPVRRAHASGGDRRQSPRAPAGSARCCPVVS